MPLSTPQNRPDDPNPDQPPRPTADAVATAIADARQGDTAAADRLVAWAQSQRVPRDVAEADAINSARAAVMRPGMLPRQSAPDRRPLQPFSRKYVPDERRADDRRPGRGGNPPFPD